MAMQVTHAAASARMFRFYLRQWVGFLAGGLAVAGTLILLRLAGVVLIIGERSDQWWGASSVVAMAIMIATLIYGAAVPAGYFHASMAASITRTSQVIAWLGAGIVALAVGAATVGVLALAVRALASSGLGQGSEGWRVILGAGGAMPAHALGPMLVMYSLVSLCGLVVLPSIIALFYRTRWWIGVPVLLVLGVLVSMLVTFLARGGWDTVDTMLVLAVYAVIGAAGFWCAVSSPIRSAVGKS